MTTAIVWTKPNCPECDRALAVLKRNSVTVEVRDIMEAPWSREALEAAVPGAKSLPQIFLDEVLVGGFNAMMTAHPEWKAKVRPPVPGKKVREAAKTARTDSYESRKTRSQAKAMARLGPKTHREGNHELAVSKMAEKKAARMAKARPANWVKPTAEQLAATHQEHRAAESTAQAAKVASMRAAKKALHDAAKAGHGAKRRVYPGNQ